MDGTDGGYRIHDERWRGVGARVEHEWSANIGRPIMRGRFSLPYRILAVQTTRPPVPYGVTSNRGVMEELEIGAKNSIHGVRVCVASYPEGRKEGSKTWLNGGPPFSPRYVPSSSSPFFFCLSVLSRGGLVDSLPPSTIIILLPLSLRYPLSTWQDRWRKSVFHPRLERNYGAGTV